MYESLEFGSVSFLEPRVIQGRNILTSHGPGTARRAPVENLEPLSAPVVVLG